MSNLASIGPIAFTIGYVKVRWYSLAYIIGALFSYWYMAKVGKYVILCRKDYDSLMSWAMFGVLIGGRIGYVFFYDLSFYLQFPLEIIKVWHGGMSFHGGFIGLVVASQIFCLKKRISVLSLMDLYSCSVPLGLFLGRIANFINGELYGRVTNVSWGMIFPASNDLLPRHPSQLYEAIFEGILLFLINNFLFYFTTAKEHKGLLFGITMTLYGVFRFVIEFFREPDIQLGYVLLNSITMGQLLSIPMVIAGIFLLIKSIANLH
ncbi:prolipoprotein diacylglyceryl transferase [Neoehrlichia mikurensis]|nr:prolipoprotein diacylglyceryl transferase [Neoehrlichia mikurensis]QXK92388.1 prolipoprotein diacylglyceryl transferase [Neoehrlichia mikurensis]QXK93235.1 prolipoprotein diacylglyceryl transferase [Neoehrlichia mikurensis]QXK93302.1 prolipoprotein diacylglyceryl transferase [Neoehrlichia mikurensis]